MLEACERIVNSLAELKDDASTNSVFDLINEEYIQTAPCLPQIFYHFSEIRPRACSIIADICVKLASNQSSFQRLLFNRTISIHNGERLQYYLYKKGFFSLDQLMDFSENKPELQEIIYLLGISNENEYEVENIFKQNTLGDYIYKDNVDGIIENQSEPFRKPFFGVHYLSGSSWLNVAAYFGCEKAYFLLADKANIDATLIDDASFGGNKAILQDAIERCKMKGIVVNNSSIFNNIILSHHEFDEIPLNFNTMLDPAIRGHNYSVIKKILSDDIPKDDFITSLLESDCLPMLTKMCSISSMSQLDLLSCSVLNQADSIFEELIKFADNPMRTSLRRFVYDSKSTQMFEFIIRHGIEVSASDLNYAAAHSTAVVVRRLITMLYIHPDTATRGLTPLMAAAMAGNYLVVKDLVRLGANVSAHDPNMATPMGLALREGHIQTAKYLAIVTDPNSTIGDADMTTPLMAAIVFGQRDLAQYLIQRGANVAAKTHQGMTPIQLALRMQDRATLDAVLDKRVLLTNDDIERLPHMPTKPNAPLSDLSSITLT